MRGLLWLGDNVGAGRALGLAQRDCKGQGDNIGDNVGVGRTLGVARRDWEDVDTAERGLRRPGGRHWGRRASGAAGGQAEGQGDDIGAGRTLGAA